MSDMTTRNGNGTALTPDYQAQIARLRAGISKSRESTVIAGGKPLLRLMKSGQWVYGQNNDEVQEGSEWASNPYSMQHGWSCWTNYPPNMKKKNELLGEVMSSIMDPKPPRPDPVQGFEYEQQAQFELKCVLGDDKDLEVTYKVSSKGGIRAVDGLQAAINAQLDIDPVHIVPILQLSSDYYDHKQYGQTHFPVFEIVGWMAMDGSRGGAPAIAAEEPVAAPVETVAAQRPGASPRRQRPPVVK